MVSQKIYNLNALSITSQSCLVFFRMRDFAKPMISLSVILPL